MKRQIRHKLRALHHYANGHVFLIQELISSSLPPDTTNKKTRFKKFIRYHNAFFVINRGTAFYTGTHQCLTLFGNHHLNNLVVQLLRQSF